MSAVEDYFEDSQLEAKQANYLSQDDNPDEAAEAVELSDSTGVPASAIHSNLEDFKRQHKLALGNAIINDNQYIQEYLNSHPLAGSVSHDDLGQLDVASQAMSNMGGKTGLQKWLDDDSISQSFMKGFGDQPIDTRRFYLALSPNMTSTGPFTPLGFKPRLLVLRRKWWVWVRSVWKASPA